DPRDDRRDLSALPERVRIPDSSHRLCGRGARALRVRNHADPADDHGRGRAGGRTVNTREFLVVLAATALFLVMAVSFLGNVNWPSSPTSLPVVDPNATSQKGIAPQMREGFPLTLCILMICVVVLL